MEFIFFVWWKKWGEPITAISIIIFFVFAVIMIKQDRALKEKINLNCGWEEDDYQCFCEKSKALEVQNKMKMGGFNPLNISGLNLENVSVVG
jgi:hypothetical protein